jgi:hypothetical protein
MEIVLKKIKENKLTIYKLLILNILCVLTGVLNDAKRLTISRHVYLVIFMYSQYWKKEIRFICKTHD